MNWNTLPPDLILLAFVAVLGAVPVGLLWLLWKCMRGKKKDVDSPAQPR